ncbi:MAG: B12-binding domain-containing radical SAM protein [Spirochaetales bacterium]|nr:B12-binding domain-containing radical SAM protein [Spirochaetales bacterium]
MKKVLFIQPTIYDDRGRPVKKSRLYFIGLAYPVLAALLPEGWEAEICLETIEDIPFDTDAELIGMGGMGHAVKRSRDLAEEFRKRGKTVIMGGPMASLAHEEVGKFANSVVIGDAETVWTQVIADYEAGCLKPTYNEKPDEFTRPLPRYDLVLDKKIGDFLPVQAGRGCPNTCSFCSIYCLYRGNYQKREIEEVIRDIRYVKELGFKKFLLIDDNIVSDPPYLMELAKEIKKLNMTWMSQCAIHIADNPELLKTVADSGCYTLSFGLESITPENFDTIEKTWCNPDWYPEIIEKVTEAGIEVASEMIVGIDGDTIESLHATADFVLSVPIIAPKFYIMTPIPGTDYYKQMCSAHRIVETDLYKFSPSNAVITHPNMSTEELNEIYWEIYERVYTIPHILRRTLFNRRFRRNPRRYLFFLMLNLFYRYQIKRRIAPNIM